MTIAGAPGGAPACERSLVVKVLKACLGVALASSLPVVGGCAKAMSYCPIHRLLYGGKKVQQVPGPQTACPVMGGEINRKLFVDHEGKRIYVCCPGCIPTIRRNAAKYVKQLEDAGVVLDKVPASKQ
jgi:hypothetical protein